MTDTTDIAALPKMTLDDLLIRCTDYEDGSLSMDAGELKMLNQHISLLEAERQRAADLVLHVNTQANMREKAEKERDGVVKNYNRVTDERNSALYEIAALKAKLANPVVLGSSDVMSRNFAIKAINAAGFTVKGE